MKHLSLAVRVLLFCLCAFLVCVFLANLELICFFGITPLCNKVVVTVLSPLSFLYNDLQSLFVVQYWHEWLVHPVVTWGVPLLQGITFACLLTVVIGLLRRAWRHPLVIASFVFVVIEVLALLALGAFFQSERFEAISIRDEYGAGTNQEALDCATSSTTSYQHCLAVEAAKIGTEEEAIQLCRTLGEREVNRCLFVVAVRSTRPDVCDVMVEDFESLDREECRAVAEGFPGLESSETAAQYCFHLNFMIHRSYCMGVAAAKFNNSALCSSNTQVNQPFCERVSNEPNWRQEIF